MTARYRCPFCGMGFESGHLSRLHLFRLHRTALIQGLGLIEGFGTTKEEIAS